MTNFEKYKSEIQNFLSLSDLGDFAVNKDTGEIEQCRFDACSNCLFINSVHACENKRLRWLYEEYESSPVDWSKVPIDTKVLVSDNGITWDKEHFAGMNGKGEPTVYAYGRTSWSQREYSVVNRLIYKYIKLAEEE